MRISQVRLQIDSRFSETSLNIKAYKMIRVSNEK